MIFAARVSLSLGLAILAWIGIGAEKSPEVRHAKLCQTRLAQNVKPLKYDIDLNLVNEFASIRGKVDILIEFSPPSSNSKSSLLHKLFNRCRASSNEILLHLGGNLEISSATFQTAQSLQELHANSGVEIKIHQIVRDHEKKMISIQLEKDLSSSSIVFGRLTMAYESRSPDPSLFIRASWQDTDSQRAVEPSHWLARLQSGQARNLLPCFDEPQFMAQIKLKATTTNRDVELMTNLEKRAPGRYESTESMPINGLILAFSSNSLRKLAMWRVIPSTEMGGPIKISVTGPGQISRRPFNDGGQWALAFAKRCLDWFQESTKIKCPFKTLDLIAVPSNINWNITDGPGLALINGNFLQLDLKTHINERNELQLVPDYEKQVEIALNVALVVARQWFGWALVPDGWSNLWISEGLAARAALQMVDQLEPDLAVYHYVRFNYLQRAMYLDDGIDFPPISHPNPAQGQHVSSTPFDMIRLVKAAAIMQLLEKTIAKDLDFDQVISSLMKRKSSSSAPSFFGSIDLQELAEAFSNNLHSGDQILDLLKPWVELSGFPTFSVTTDNDLRAISVHQLPTTRLNAGGKRVEDNASQWPVSLKFNYYSQMNLHFNEVGVYEVMKGHRRRIELPDWLRNVGSPKIDIQDDYQTLPYYRVDCSKSGISC